MSGRPVAFLDRDGVLNELVVDPVSGVAGSPHASRDVRLIAGAGEALARLAEAGFALVCVTNQPAAAKGTASIEELLEVHGRVIELLAREGVALEASRLCWHHPEGVVPELTKRCDCRKPGAGMLLDAAVAVDADLSASWMIGDTDVDVAAGRAAGARTVLVEYPPTAHKRSSSVPPNLLAVDLQDGVAKAVATINRRHFTKSPFASLRAG